MIFNEADGNEDRHKAPPGLPTAPCPYSMLNVFSSATYLPISFKHGRIGCACCECRGV